MIRRKEKKKKRFLLTKHELLEKKKYRNKKDIWKSVAKLKQELPSFRSGGSHLPREIPFLLLPLSSAWRMKLSKPPFD